jgi:hypothetical protein
MATTVADGCERDFICPSPSMLGFQSWKAGQILFEGWSKLDGVTADLGNILEMLMVELPEPNSVQNRHLQYSRFFCTEDIIKTNRD